MKHLGLSKNTLRRAREILQEKGAIDYHTYAGRGKAVRYMILKTDLAPELKGSKIHPFVDNSRKGSEFNRKGSNSDPFTQAQKGSDSDPQEL